MKRDHQPTIDVTAEARADRLFDVFISEHAVPEWLHEDLREEITLAVECYSDTVDDAGIRQSELLDYMEEYLVGWVSDCVEARGPSEEDMFNWGFWEPEERPRAVITAGISVIIY